MVRHLFRALLPLTLAAAPILGETSCVSPYEVRFGLHFSEIAIQGDHMKDVDALFSKLEYRVVAMSWVTGWTQFNNALDKQPISKTRVRKAVYVSHGWTHIVDPELVIFTEEKILAKESQALHAKIITWLCESTSDTYGFTVYENGRMLRSVLKSRGEIDTKGNRLAAEHKIVWKDAGEDEVLAVTHVSAQRFIQRTKRSRSVSTISMNTPDHETRGTQTSAEWSWFLSCGADAFGIQRRRPSNRKGGENQCIKNRK